MKRTQSNVVLSLTLCSLTLMFGSSVAAAQPVPPAPVPPAPIAQPGQPPIAQPAGAPAAPPSAQPPQPAPQADVAPGAQPAPQMQPAPQIQPTPISAQPQPQYLPPVRSGLTFEANIGIGLMHFRSSEDADSEFALGGLSLGVGGFMGPNTAITARVAGGTYTNNNNGGQISQGVLGVYVQQWVAPNAWLGGGVGLGFIAARGGSYSGSAEAGFGFGARAGFVLNPGINSFNISGELTSSIHPSTSEGTLSASVLSVLIGYQRL